jgi:hypothetical protein
MTIFAIILQVVLSLFHVLPSSALEDHWSHSLLFLSPLIAPPVFVDLLARMI